MIIIITRGNSRYYDHNNAITMLSVITGQKKKKKVQFIYGFPDYHG